MKFVIYSSFDRTANHVDRCVINVQFPFAYMHMHINSNTHFAVEDHTSGNNVRN